MLNGVKGNNTKVRDESRGPTASAVKLAPPRSEASLREKVPWGEGESRCRKTPKQTRHRKAEGAGDAT